MPHHPVAIMLADGPIEIIIGHGQIEINDRFGPILVIFEARAIVLKHSDVTEVYGGLTPEPQAN